VWLAPAGAEPAAGAHELLLELAGTMVGSPTLEHDETGRPVISGLAVSITRSHQMIAVAASYDGPLGIDLEELHPRPFAPLARRWFTAAELTWMDSQPDQLQAFLQLWTAKEAMGKALGLGLRQSGLRRQMPLPNSPATDGLIVTHAPVENAVLAIATSHDVSDVVIRAGSSVSSTLDPPCARG
jgi:phosphopantetheinyl transferase